MKKDHIEIKLSVNKVLYLAIHIAFMVALILWSISLWDNHAGSGYENAVFPWVLASLIVNLIGFIFAKKAKYVDIGLIFVLCSYLFMFGHVFLKVFELSTTLTWNPSIYFSDLSKFHASLYAIFCLSVLTCGYVLCENTSYQKNEKLNADEDQECHNKSFYNVGWFFFCIGLVANAITSTKIISATLASNSYASYTIANTSGILDDLAYLFVPGIVYIFSSRILSKGKSTILMVICIIYLVGTMVFSGSRKTQIFAIVTIVLCYLWNQKRSKLSFGKIAGIVIGGILFLNLIYVIRENRFELLTIIPSYFESLSNFKFLSSIVAETFAETGISFYAVVAIITNVPSVFPYEYGMIVIRTIPSILPIGWLVGDFFNKATSSYVINRYTGLPVGTSVIGDFYWNFGFLGGVLISFLLGILLSRLTRKTLENDKEPLYFSVLYILMIGIRAGIFELFRPLVMVALVPLVIRSLFRRSN